MNNHALHLTRLAFGLKGKDNSFPKGNQEDVCIANIGPLERQRRLSFGVVMFFISVAIAAALIFTDVDRVWRIGLFFPFYLAAIGFFQAHEKT